VVSKPSIRLKVKAGRRIQAQEYIELSIESGDPTPRLGLRGGFETTSHDIIANRPQQHQNQNAHPRSGGRLWVFY